MLLSSRWIYTLYLMIDANFRAQCKDRGLEDVELAPGWSYYVEENAYQAHVEVCKGQKEVRGQPLYVSLLIDCTFNRRTAAPPNIMRS